MSPPAQTCRACFWYRRENISRDLPTHGSCTVATPVAAVHANSRGCAQWTPTGPEMIRRVRAAEAR